MRQLRVLKCVPPLVLNLARKTARRRSNRRGHHQHKGNHKNMKTLDTIMTLLSWIVLAIVLYALAPVLIKLIAVAQGVHHVFGT
jgi:hypothetical protein